MKFAIQVNSSPYQSQASATAYQFVETALRKGHQVVRVFFYHEGIYNGLHDAASADDDWSIARCWSALAKDHDIDLVLCISAAQQRGLPVAETAGHTGKAESNVAEGFHLAGLGQWVDAIITADRVVSFGG